MNENAILYFSLIACVVLGIVLMFYFSPAQVLARAIKEIGKNEKKMYVIEETEEYFVIESGVRILKKWYDLKNDCYIVEYGYYVPIYVQNEINSFIFMRK